MTPNPPRMRLATLADVPALSALRLALFRELDPIAVGNEREFFALCRAAYAEMFDAGRGMAWVAEANDGAVVATITLLFHHRLPSPPLSGTNEGYVVGVFTHVDWRGRGLATALVDVALDEARRRGLVRIRLHATEKGRRIYAARGFHARDDEMERAL